MNDEGTKLPCHRDTQCLTKPAAPAQPSPAVQHKDALNHCSVHNGEALDGFDNCCVHGSRVKRLMWLTVSRSARMPVHTGSSEFHRASSSADVSGPRPGTGGPAGARCSQGSIASSALSGETWERTTSPPGREPGADCSCWRIAMVRLHTQKRLTTHTLEPIAILIVGCHRMLPNPTQVSGRGSGSMLTAFVCEWTPCIQCKAPRVTFSQIMCSTG